MVKRIIFYTVKKNLTLYQKKQVTKNSELEQKHLSYDLSDIMPDVHKKLLNPGKLQKKKSYLRQKS